MEFAVSGAGFWPFVVFVGVGAVLVLDLWSLLMAKLGLVIMDWGLIGRLLLHLCTPEQVRRRTPPTRMESLLGYVLHYVFGMAYVALLVSVWPDFILCPRLIPVLLICFCLPSLIGQLVLVPLLGPEFYRHRKLAMAVVYQLIVASHAIFGISVYGFAHALRFFR